MGASGCKVRRLSACLMRLDGRRGLIYTTGPGDGCMRGEGRGLAQGAPSVRCYYNHNYYYDNSHAAGTPT